MLKCDLKKTNIKPISSIFAHPFLDMALDLVTHCISDQNHSSLGLDLLRMDTVKANSRDKARAIVPGG